jgi:excisionase family DNA binding protein
MGDVKLAQRESGWFGYCGHHEEITEEETYRYKGCWGCQHFEFGEAFPYVFVSEAAEELHVSESTVRRLIKKGTLDGELFAQVRITRSLPSPAKYHILKESLKEFIASIVSEHDRE